MQILASLILLCPLLASIFNGFYSCMGDQTKDSKKASFFSIIMILAATFSASIVFYHVAFLGEKYNISLSHWFYIRNISIDFAIYIDQLTSIMFLVVTVVSSVVHIYSLGYMSEDERLSKFLCFLSLFTFFMLALVAADNFIQLFFGWEGVGFCSYLLIGYWHTKDAANSAATKAFITNRVSDCAFIIAIIMIIFYTDCVTFQGVFAHNQSLSSISVKLMNDHYSVLDIICFLLFVGCMGKSAQIGLHVWLPDAMEGPTPVSALIHAATMVTAGVFLLARCSYLFEYSPNILQFITIIGGVTCLFAATIAITQSDIKKIIAYSTCSQLGYMFVACGVSAYQAGIFHLVTHATFKALLFLCAGNVIHACHQQDIFEIGGLRKKMPVTFTYFLIGSLAIIGLYPLAGYYSKDLILESAYQSNHLGQFVFWLGIIAAILTAIYSTKIISLVFYGETKLSVEQFDHVTEANAGMNLPLAVLVFGSITSGAAACYFLNIENIPGYFADSIFVKHYSSEHDINSIIKLLPSIAGIFGILAGIYIYKDSLFKNISNRFGIVFKIVNNKYYFDEIYNLLFVRFITRLSLLSNQFDRNIVDYILSKTTVQITSLCSAFFSQVQSGYIFGYIVIMMMSIILCITTILWQFLHIG